jgi:hypothetical protein
MDIDSLFKGMREAAVYGRGNYMSEGEYRVRVTGVKCQASQKKRGETFFVCEFEVAEIFASKEPEKHRVGSSGTWLPKFSQASTFGNIKELMFAILGVRGSDVPESAVEQHELATALATAACGSENGKAALKEKFKIDDVNAIVEGAEVLLTCVQTKTREGNDFTRYQWGPVPVPGVSA